MHENTLPLLPLVLAQVPQGLRQVLAQEGISTAEHAQAPVAGRFVLFDSRKSQEPSLAAGQTPIDVARLRSPLAADPLAALVDESSAPHAWESAGVTAVEEIARFDKRCIRRDVLDQLRAQIEAAGGVWLRVAAFPLGYRTAFNFRIDYDHYQPDAFKTTLAALTEAADCTSHFVNGAAYADHPRALQRLRGMDVGSHAYWHHIYRDESDNHANLARGINVLRRAGIEPAGFVAPHGRFHRGLLAAMNRLGIAYSSEFSLNYDDLPFVPDGSRVLQIPIHPVCPELFLEAADRNAGLDAAWRHWERITQINFQAGEPLFFYGHPTGRHGSYPELLARLVDGIGRQSGVWRTTLTAFAAWWRVHSEVALSVRREAGQLVVTAERLPSEYRFALEYVSDRGVATIPIYGDQLRCNEEQLAWEDRRVLSAERPRPVARTLGLRGHVKRILDWERVTPVDQIVVRDWRTWTKRTLRRLQEKSRPGMEIR